ncbi:MAG: glycosyltransferase family 4 protein [Methanomassiliicoccales archaeon]
MRVTFVTFEYPPLIMGGAGVYAANLTKELAKLGHEVKVITFGGEKCDNSHPTEKDGIIVDRVQGKASTLRWIALDLKISRKIGHAPRSQRPDVVHLNSLGYIGLRDKSKGPPYVATAHHLVGEIPKRAGLRFSDRIMDFFGENGFLIPAMERFGTSFVDRIIAVSHKTAQGLQTLYKVDFSRIDIIWNGVSEEVIPVGLIDPEEARRRLGLPAGKVILFVGRVDDPRKCLGNIIKAASGIPDTYVVAVGSGDGRRAMELARELGMGSRVKFLGRLCQEELWYAYLGADVHVCASQHEGFGLTIIEAMCAGCPVISTDVGIARELSERLRAVVPVNDVPALRSAIISTLSASTSIQQAKTVRVPEELSWRRCAMETVECYKKSIEEKSRTRY